MFLSSTKPPSCHMCDGGCVGGGDEAAMLLGGTVVVVVLVSTVLGDSGQFTWLPSDSIPSYVKRG